MKSDGSKIQNVEMTRNQWVQYRHFCLFQNTRLFQEAKIVEKGLLIESAESTVSSLLKCVFFTVDNSLT